MKQIICLKKTVLLAIVGWFILYAFSYNPRQDTTNRYPVTDQLIQHQSFGITSGIMGNFWGETVRIDTWIVLPHDYQKGQAYPVCYDIEDRDASIYMTGEYLCAETVREWAELQKSTDLFDCGCMVNFLLSCISVFSRPDGNGEPKPLFDWETGNIFQDTVRDWERYDLAKLFQKRWPDVGDKLKGKITLYNTNNMPGIFSFQEVLEQLGSDAVFNNQHRNKKSLVEEIHREIWEKYLNN